jgi:hypothetical protein
MTTMNEIEAAAKAARDARNSVHQRATMLQESIEQLKRKHLPHLRNGVAKVAEADARLMELLQSAPALFTRPRSVVFHGLKIGYAKGTGKLEITDPASVVKLVRRHFPEQFDLLVKTKETPIKKTLQELPAADLKRLGITVQDTGDVVFIKDATDSVDKLVAALLKGEEEQAEEEGAEA